MITEIVSFNIPKGTSRAQVLKDAKTTIDRWRGFPGLVRKYYVMQDAETAMGIYLWESLEAAKTGHDSIWLDKAEARWGNRPKISYYDTVMELDNRHDEIIEYTEKYRA